jgi:hypothetical protein
MAPPGRLRAPPPWSAHYGLYRERSFDTFEQDFLKRDIEAFIWGTFLLPWNWESVVNPLYGTNDRMSEVYDRLMFHGATFPDLQYRGLPEVSVVGTDIANGVSFPASNGFPVVFSPITLTSFRRDRKGTVAARTGATARRFALRGLLSALRTIDEKSGLFRSVVHHTRRVLVFSIDRQAATDLTLGQLRMVTGLATIFSAVSSTQIDAYNVETLLPADQEVARCVEAPVIDGHRCDDVQDGLVHGSLDNVTNPEQQRRAQSIRTGLTIPGAGVDALVSWGARLVVENPKIRSLTSGLDGSRVKPVMTLRDASPAAALRRFDAALPNRARSDGGTFWIANCAALDRAVEADYRRYRPDRKRTTRLAIDIG